MAEMIFGQTLGISVPAGRYSVRFVGTEDRPNMVTTMGPNAGKEQARMAWIFEITEGPNRGERIPQETGTAAVQRSGALKMLTGLNGGPMAIGQKVDTNSFVGRAYTLKIAPNPDSPKGNLHIADIEPVQGGGTGAPTSSPPRAPAAPPAPRPASPPAPPKPAAAEPRYWIHDGTKGELMTATVIRDCLKTDPTLANVWQWIPESQEGGWQPVAGSFLDDNQQKAPGRPAPNPPAAANLA